MGKIFVKNFQARTFMSKEIHRTVIAQHGVAIANTYTFLYCKSTWLLPSLLKQITMQEAKSCLIWPIAVTLL